jgi:glycolate oxidase FAD binding subunit
VAVWTPEGPEQVLDAVQTALADGARLEIVGTGTRRAFGRPVEADVVLDLSKLNGIVDYQPDELVLTVEPGVTVAEIEAVLAARGQHLAFEPPDFGPLWGLAAGGGTIGGSVMTGRGGPRRLSAGAPRDHFLGMKGVNGFGEAFAAGGRVVKNVTGFDIAKLLAGSFGTLSVVTEMTLKVLPAPPDEVTLVLHGLDDAAGIAAMTAALGSPAAVTAAAHLPEDGLTILRLEGVTPSIAARAEHLTQLLGGVRAIERRDRDASRALWKAVCDAAAFVGTEQVVWKLSVAPSNAADIAQAIGGQRFYDWGGGGLWIALPPAADAHAARIRAALAGEGHATLMRAPDTVRATTTPFQPLEPGVAALTQRVKDQFDPKGIFNPGRMYAGA